MATGGTAMGVGYSSSFGTVSPSTSIGRTVPEHLLGAANNLSLVNSAPPFPQQTISGYSGPTIPQMRSDPSVDAFAQQVMGLLMRQIPALAPQGSVPVSSVMPQASNPTVASSFSRHVGVSSSPGQPPSYVVVPSTTQPGGPGRPSPYVAMPAPLLPSGQLPSYVAVPPPLPSSGQLPPYVAVPQALCGQGLQPQDMLDPFQPQQQVPQARFQESVRQPLSNSQLLQFQDQNQVNNVSLDSLMSAHVKFKQYYAHDFCKLASFPYLSQLKPSNLNLSLFSYGSVKHLLALSDRTLSPVTKAEFNSRLQHILNVLEISCLGSNLTDFDTHSWRVAREYNFKVIKEIELGYKSWETLNRCIDPTNWAYAKEIVPKPAQKQQNQGSTKNQNNQRLCTTFNTFRQNGCHYEANNPGETCVYLHACSHCRQKGSLQSHKAFQCSDAPPAKQNPRPPASAPVNSTSTPPVTSV